MGDAAFALPPNKILTGYSPGKQDIILQRRGTCPVPESPDLFEASERSATIICEPSVCALAHIKPLPHPALK